MGKKSTKASRKKKSKKKVSQLIEEGYEMNWEKASPHAIAEADKRRKKRVAGLSGRKVGMPTEKEIAEKMKEKKKKKKGRAKKKY